VDERAPGDASVADRYDAMAVIGVAAFEAPHRASGTRRLDPLK
jgi:hypothetical protein